MDRVAVKPSRFRKTRIAASLATILGVLGTGSYALADTLVPVSPPPISSYPGDPGALGNPASWKTAEFLRDWGLTALSAEYAYSAGFAGQGMNVGVVDSGYFLGWLPEHQDAIGNDRWISVTADGGTTGPTPGFYNQSYNDTHGTHVSGTVAARRDGTAAALAANLDPAADMHGVSFDSNVSFGNTHKTDSVYYGLQPAGAADRLLLDNAYLENVYPAVDASVAPNGAPVRVIHSSWGSQPGTENYNTYCPPANGPASFGLLASWQYISTPDGVADANGHLNHWLNGAFAVARTGTIISFSAGNGGYIYTTPRGSSSYFMPELEGRWVVVSGVRNIGQQFNSDGSILVPGTQQFNQCGVAKWACVTAPSQSINSTTVSVVNGTPVARYGSLSGTSMAGPHSASTLNLVMQRFPYMTNEQAMYTMFTTARQNATISDSNGAAVPNPAQGQMVQAPDSRNGWGTPNLKDAFRGPGQLLGVFSIDTKGFSDVWSNDISDVALKARQQEDAAEAALWQTSHVTNSCVLGLPPDSPLLQTDFAAGTARAAARASRVYSGMLTKDGGGTLFLTGHLTYSGSTNVNGGKVSIDGSHATDVVVNGGTLGGKGSIAGSINVVTGLLWPGLSPEESAFIGGASVPPGNVLSVGSPVHIGHKAGFAATIRSSSDYTQVVTASNLILDGTLFLDMEGAPTPGAVLTIMSGKKVVGTFSDLPEGSMVIASGQRFRISYLGNKVTLTALGT